MIWTILGIISIILLIVYFNFRNAVWGGFTIGFILGLVVTIMQGFNWSILGKFIVVCVLLGFGAELLGKVGDLLKKK